VASNPHSVDVYYREAISGMIKKIGITDEDLEAFRGLEINLQDIQNDNYDYSKVVVNKPWGYEYMIFANEEIAVWILYLKSGAQTSMHCHPNKKTSLVVLEGNVACSAIKEQIDRHAGEGLLIEKGAFHQTSNVSDAGAFVMEIEAPVNKRDLVRLKDNYGREGQGYESADHHSPDTQNYNYISFQNLDIQHNLKKSYGRCSMTFKKLSDEKVLDEILDLNPEDVICLLKGLLLDPSNRSVVEVGDTMTVAELRQYGPLHVSRDTEMLTIKKVDRFTKISDYVASFLYESEINPVFIVPGEANVHLLDSIGRHEGLSFVGMQNEKSASLAVESFCKLRSGIGALVVSSGAAAANAVPGVANAWADSVPMLVISGQARTDQDTDGRVRQLGNKELNVVDLVESITKYAVKVTDPATVKYHLEKAVYTSTQGRPGPVWIDLPIDIQGMVVDEEELIHFDSNEITATNSGVAQEGSGQIQKVMELLKGSARPVILAGSGIRHANAAGKFLELTERLEIPILTSRRGADLVPDNHPNFFGRPGTYGQRSANFVLQNCDLLISIGSRLSIPQIGRDTKAFARAASLVMVDIDQNELDKPTLNPELKIAMDAGRFIDECLAALPEDLPSCSAWIEQCREWRKQFPPDSYTGPSLPSAPSEDGSIYPLSAIREISARLAEDDVVVADGGATLIYTLLGFRFKPGQRLISSTGLELPGFALAGAIGASVANGRQQVVCLCEDRGFQISIQDLQTIIDYRLPVKVLIFRSKGHSIIRNIQRDFFGGRFVGTDNETRLGSAPLIEIAKTFGFQTFQATTAGELDSALDEWLKTDGPAVCEVHVEDDQDRIPRPGFTIRDDQKWVAKPLEDMSPFLDRKTLIQTMVIDLVRED